MDLMGQMSDKLILCLTFLKVRLLLDLMRLDTTTQIIGSKFPREILDLIIFHVPLSKTVTDNRSIMYSNDITTNEMLF